MKLIYVKIFGRLGNQMFQYAFARSLQEKRRKMNIHDELMFCSFTPATVNAFLF